MDPIEVRTWMEVAQLTQEEIDEFKTISKLMIDTKIVEPMSNEQTLQAIDRVGYEIASLAAKTALNYPLMTQEEVEQLPDIKQQLEQLDEIMVTIAYGSQIHIAIINLVAMENSMKWTDKIVEQLIKDRT